MKTKIKGDRTGAFSGVVSSAGDGAPSIPNLWGDDSQRFGAFHLFAGAGSEGGTPFDVSAYSLMKHGDLEATRAFADLLADLLIERRPELVNERADVVLPVSYVHVPPGCFYLAQHVAMRLSRLRHARGLSSASVVRIHKARLADFNYAASSLAERQAEMASQTFTLDESVDGKQVLVVDDVRVTGMTERVSFMATLADSRPHSVVFSYVAMVCGDLADDPSVESRLNLARVTSILDMLPSIERGEFGLTIRFLKKALASDPKTLAYFARHCPRALLEEMLDGARGSGEKFARANHGALTLIEKEMSLRVH